MLDEHLYTFGKETSSDQSEKIMTCIHCEAGDIPIKMKRRYIHRIEWNNIPCPVSGFTAEPGEWADCRPREWIPRRIRRQEKSPEK